MVEEGVHLGAGPFVGAADVSPCGGCAAGTGAADTGQDGGDYLVAQGEQGGDGARGQRRNPTDGLPAL